MRSIIHNTLKGLYLVILCITLPLALMYLAPSFSTDHWLKLILLIATYGYSMYWLIFFVLIPLFEFPESEKAAALCVLAPILNSLGHYLINGNSDNYFDFLKSSSAMYFLSTTIALTALCVSMLIKGSQYAKSSKDISNGKKAAAFLFILSLTYSLLINYHVFAFTILNSADHKVLQSIALLIFTSIITSTSLISNSNSVNDDVVSEKNPQTKIKNSVDHWQTIIVCAMLLSGAASMIVLASKS